MLGKKRQQKALPTAMLLVLMLSCANSAWAGAREQAKRMHDRLTGVLPTNAVLNCMEAMIASTNSPVHADCDSSNPYYDGNDADSAAKYAMENNNFYNVTLKNFITPWTNEEQDKFASLNDYTATVIGMIRDDKPFNTLLSANILYTANGTVSPSAAANSNQHYINMESSGYNLKDVLVETTQTAAYGLTDAATAGIVTTRAAARAFFVDGTNRAMFRFTMMNHLCNDLEQIKDTTRVADRIRQDVSRSPGGDSRIFLNNCLGCHAGMDGLAGAYAYYEWDYPEGGDPDTGSLLYTDGTVQGKHLINSNNFKTGYVTVDDSWVNYWRAGPNYLLGWASGIGRGNGAKSMGQELANTDAFAQCQVKKVFKAVCLRPPVDSTDRSKVSTMVSTFKGNGYKMKQVFADAAVYCKGP